MTMTDMKNNESGIYPDPPHGLSIRPWRKVDPVIGSPLYVMEILNEHSDMVYKSTVERTHKYGDIAWRTTTTSSEGEVRGGRHPQTGNEYSSTELSGRRYSPTMKEARAVAWEHLNYLWDKRVTTDFDVLPENVKLSKNDEAKIGTNEYQGHAYFWGQEYKFTLRGDWLSMGGIDILHPDGRRYGTTDFNNKDGEYDDIGNPILVDHANAEVSAVRQMRKAIHDEWLARGLDFLGVSTEHKAIVDHYGWIAVRQIADAVGGTVSKGNFHAERKE